MITLARHIELLLLEHDCVIVPGLGGFIANHADARYVGGDEHLFLPPYRTIGFNQQLQVNDGLLVQSYMAAYDTSYPFAYLQMEKDLEKMMFELEMNGEYVLDNVGVIKKGLNQNITFVAPETGALTPSLYGLYSCEMDSLQHVVKAREIAANLQQAASAMQIASHAEKPQPSPRKEVVIHLNRHWLDFGISVAAAVLLLFCFSYPAMKNISTESDTVVAAFTPMGDAIATSKPSQPVASKVTVKVPVAEHAESQTEGKAIVETPEKENTIEENHQIEEKPVQNKPATQKYTIVLASFVSQQNAETFIENLKKDGLTEGRYVKAGKTSRILYSGYATEADARTALNALREQNAAFADAWLLELEEEN